MEKKYIEKKDKYYIETKTGKRINVVDMKL